MANEQSKEKEAATTVTTLGGKEVAAIDVSKLSVPVEKPSYTKMSNEEYEAEMRKVQLGETDVVPGGQKLTDVFRNLQQLEKEQAAARDLIALGKKTTDPNAPANADELAKNQVQVHTTSNGVTTAHPLVAPEENLGAGTQSTVNPEDSDIPKDFPGRTHLIKAGGTNAQWATVSTYSYADFAGVPGFTENIAKKALEFLAKDSSGD